jgi:hypothetical protein
MKTKTIHLQSLRSLLVAACVFFAVFIWTNKRVVGASSAAEDGVFMTSDEQRHYAIGTPLANTKGFSFKSTDGTIILSPGNWDNANGVDCYTVVNNGEGYVMGTNTFSDRVKSQKFWVEQPYAIVGAYFWFHEVTDGGGKVNFKVWDMTGGRVGQVLASKSVDVSDITSSATLENAFYVAFDSPVQVHGDYLIGFDMTDIAWSVIGLNHTENGSGGFLGLNWEQWNDNRWFLILESWGLNLDLAIFPATISLDALSAAPASLPRSSELLLYPNPARHVLNIEAGSVIQDVRILDLLGKQVLYVPVGAYTHTIDTSVLRPGLYFVQVALPEGMTTQRLQVSK